MAFFHFRKYNVYDVNSTEVCFHHTFMADRMDSRQQKTRFVKPKNCIDFLGSHLHCLEATLAKTQTSFYRTHDSSPHVFKRFISS